MVNQYSAKSVHRPHLGHFAYPKMFGTVAEIHVFHISTEFIFQRPLNTLISNSDIL